MLATSRILMEMPELNDMLPIQKAEAVWPVLSIMIDEIDEFLKKKGCADPSFCSWKERREKWTPIWPTSS